MTDRPKHDEPPSLEKEPFEEALDAAEVFNELADDEAAAGADEQASAEKAFDAAGDPSGAISDPSGAISDPFADEFELAPQRPPAQAEEQAAPALEVEAVGATQTELVTETPAATPPPAPARGPSESSIGELFKPVVRHSPPSRIRIEAESVGALFRRFIEQE